MNPNTPANPPYTWQGKGLRLVDLLDQEERKAVLGAFPSERQFRAEHILGDATEFVKHAERHGLMEDVEELMSRQVWEKTLEGMGWEIATAMDGRLDVIPLGDMPPVRGTIAPGSRSHSQIAYDYIKGLEAQGKHADFPTVQHSQKPVYVSKSFAEYLRAAGEPVKAITKDRDGDVALIWPARHDDQVNRAMRDFHLASVGANEPDGGALARVAASKAPKQFAVWKAGLSDQWRMMDSLREVLLGSATAMTSGSYADVKAGGALSEGLRSFQQAFQYLGEDAASKQPTMRSTQALATVADKVVAAATYLDQEAPVKQTGIHQALIDGVDLAATIGKELEGKYVAHMRLQHQPTRVAPDAANGLG